jgi:hypothetical protein
MRPIAEAGHGVHALCHLGRLDARRLTSARASIVHVERRQRGSYGVDALGHLRRLQARRLTAAHERVVDEVGGRRRAKSAPPGMLQRSDGVDPAIAAEIKGLAAVTFSPSRRATRMWWAPGSAPLEVRRHADDPVL